MASFYWRGSGGNWNATGNWSSTSGGASNGAIPTAADDVYLDGATGAGGNISANITIKSLTVTSGYAYAVNFATTYTLTVVNNITLGANMTFTGFAGAFNSSGTATITSNGISFPGSLILSGAVTKTYTGDILALGVLTVSAATVLNKSASESLLCYGMTLNAAISGTARVVLKGGSWIAGSNLFSAAELVFDGNVTLGPAVVVGNNVKITRLSGTITTTGSTLSMQSTAVTFDTVGMVWNNISTSGTATTVTCASLLSIGSTLNLGGAMLNFAFAGSGGASVFNFLSSAQAAQNITFQNSVNYYVVNSLSAYQSRFGSKVAFKSNDATLRANLILDPAATNNVFADFTRIDASGGRPVRTYNGVVVDSPNVYPFNDIPTSSKSF